MHENVVSVRDVWKIFGRSGAALIDRIANEDLTKDEVRERYGCVVGVSAASFDVRKGEIFCIMGLSGSGKSTLIRHINRLLEPTAGKIFINGEDITALSEPELRRLRARRIGMVFQNIALLPHRTVRDNVALPLEVQGMKRSKRFEVAEESLRLVNLVGWEDKYAHELSGGMQQRVGLARAMAADPDILLMDEPFSALDPLIRRQLQDQFMELASGMQKTTIFITHDLDEAIRIGHRIAIMKDGAIVQTGTPEEIVTNPIDAYVADFVAGISKLKLIYARSIMRPFDWSSYPEINMDACPRANESDTLDRLIDLSVGSIHPLLILSEDNSVSGIISKDDLLRGIQGGK
ncbi:quaternary amine ABC transporter ATP-binding protein [Aquamicrobium defluvii]|uniref:Quaternary amine transport ATP-binding protein n=1 Tax=Aquamicrobium defluvii TaxID=69279 RepID=A0A011UFL0_9HYPH|nr:glycine betaine/L-proline ABC transporter ATP-binding protein [Aquamicrobium defluvii]EXL04926.1 glycine/betaine ABC transporter [Aquamicrobium defluvii]EZQ14556.1 glycine/betaine ABC transporter [Halopseudomonas bauzanensis]